MFEMKFSIIAFAVSFLVAVLIAKPIIKGLKYLKFGQEIREEGPTWHNKKRGTPTIGGLIFWTSVPVAIAVCFKEISPRLIWAAATTYAFGIIGFIDDYIKVVKKRNLGLKSKQKSALQLLVTLAMLFSGLYYGIISPEVYIPFVKTTVSFGWLYIPFAIFVVIGINNSVNLTDGVDGLAASVTIVVMLFFAVALSAFTDLSVFIYAVLGGLFGFLLYNKNPAKVFMGDTGSLFLGGAVASLALASGNPIIMVTVGFVYFMEALSVILQVISFKLTGKRIFKMSPIHHHFEMCGWKEKKIVLVAVLVTIILSIISLLG